MCRSSSATPDFSTMLTGRAERQPSVQHDCTQHTQSLPIHDPHCSQRPDITFITVPQVQHAFSPSIPACFHPAPSSCHLTELKYPCRYGHLGVDHLSITNSLHHTLLNHAQSAMCPYVPKNDLFKPLPRACVPTPPRAGLPACVHSAWLCCLPQPHIPSCAAGLQTGAECSADSQGCTPRCVVWHGPQGCLQIRPRRAPA